MKKIKSVLSTLFIGIMLTTLFYPAFKANGAESAAIIADHENATLADLLAIPLEWINQARADLHIYYNHTSHGSQIPDGMTGLAGFRGSAYAWNSSGSNSALHLADTYSTDLGNSNWHGITRNYLNAHPNMNVVMWSWCGQVSSASEADINNYLSRMNQLEQDYPNVHFVYMTGHTDGSGISGNLHLRNEQIRQYCRTNNKLLFDFADIESYDPDGNDYLNKAVTDECKYDSDGNGTRESNWATAWQAGHTENVDWYMCGSAHSQPLNANMKAYAAWYLWARLAGWDGVSDGAPGGGDGDATPTPSPEPTSTPTATPTPQPTPSPSPTPTPQPTPSPSPTPTPQPIPSPSPTPTPTPGVAPPAGTQASQLTARHYEGQTLLTWNEISEVAAAVSDRMTVQQVKNLRTSMNQITYRIYRSTSPITSVAGLTPIKIASVLSGWDDEHYGRENSNINNQPCPRFAVEKDTNDVAATPVSADTAVSAYNPAIGGTAYYAVTAVRNGVEEALISAGNTVMVSETVGQGIPILQKVTTVEDYFYTEGDSKHYYYTRWESPPNSNVQGRPMDYKVIIPEAYVPGTPAPVNMSFHGWGSSMHGNSGWWYNFNKGTISITMNQFPYDWWTGYHEKYGLGERTQQNWASGVVRPYTQNRLNSFYDWAATKWSLDQSRTIAAGVSMGGSGSIMYGIRNPDRVAWVNSWVGVHVPAESPTFKSSYQGVYGQVEWNIKYQDGITPAFSFYDDDWYLRNHISEDTPFITFSNGKNDSSIGWSQAVKFVNALQDTKRPHIFYWGMGGHNQRTLNPPDINGNRSEQINPIDIRTNQSLPAFTNCSLDDDPGNGNADNGDESGQMNAYLFWKTGDIVDTPHKWEITVGVVQSAPAQSCTVSLTPRRLQNFSAAPGSICYWTNTSLSNNALLQSGTATCDANGLITIDNLAVNLITQAGGGNRIVIHDGLTVTPTPTPTGTPHPTPAVTPTPTPTVTPRPTSAVTPTPTPANTPTPTPVITATPTPAITPTPTQKPIPSSSAAPTPTPTAIPAPSSGAISTFEDGKTPATVIHVAVNGNDTTGNGGAVSPFRTVGRAVQAAAPGTAVRIHPGTYSARVNINGLPGTAQAPIWIGGAPGEAKPVITSSSEGIHLTKVRYLILHDLEIANTPENAINCDDGGEYSNPDATRYVIFRNLYIHGIGTSGNEDGLKLSGVNNYYILNCEITNCGDDYGSGIDHVGCHNGVIANNYLHDFSGTAIQCKGGSENIEIRGNRLVDCGERAVNIGGSSDHAFFRPPLSTTQPNYEAKNIRIYGNVMRGTIAPLAFVGATGCSAVNNTILSPENWLIRILQETTTSAPYTFGPCANNTVANNIFYYDGSDLSQYGEINVGNNTSPATFTFSNNLWYNHTSPQHSTPNLPVTETSGIYGQDPLFADLADSNVSLHTNSPALGKGIYNASAPVDYNGASFGNPRNIGAVAGSSSAVQNQPPVLAGIGAKTVSSGSVLSFTANGNDPDAGEALVYSISPVSPATLPAGISLNPSTGAFSWTPGQNQCGTFTVRITVSDGELNDSENVTISVTDGTVNLYNLRMKYVPTIDASMKANLRAIKLRGDTKGRDAGVLGQWGDSITHSQAYLGSMASWGMISTPPSNGHDYEPILLWMGASEIGDNNPLHNFKGGHYGNDSGWRIGSGLAAIDDAIAAANPSWSLTMFGTNDITSWNEDSFETNLERFIQINIDEGIIPVLSTIPPRTNYDQQVSEANTVIRRVAQRMNIPLVDLYGLFLELHPNDWSSVLLGDGVHPSHSYGSGDLSDAALRNDGYNIRSVLTLDMAEKLKRIVFDNGSADGTQAPILVVSSTTHPYKTMSVGLNAAFQINHDSGPAPQSYSWVLDQNPYTTPDTVSEGSSASINVNVPGDGTWYFHVRASNSGTWGSAAHYCIMASEFPKVVIRRTGENPTAVRDTYISQMWGGDDNFGGASGLNVYNDDVIKRTRGLFRFDLSGVSKTGITSAKLKLWTGSPVEAAFDYEIYAVTSAWTEGTGTWNNGDHSGIVWNDGLTFGSSPLATGIFAQAQDFIEVDVTNQVLAWLDGAQNQGFMLQHLEQWKALEIVSSENGLQEMRPSLTIEYNTPAGQWNNAPVLGSIGAKTINEGENLSFAISATDQDSGDTLTYSVSPVSPSSLPSGAGFNPATRVFSWTPGQEQSGTYTLRFTVSDGKQTDTEDVVITVRNMTITPPQGRNVRVTTVAELRTAIQNAQDGDTILIADGTYQNGNPLILNNVDDIAIRSESNNPTKVILRGRSSFTGTGSYDELDDILRIGECNNVHVSGLTLTQAHGYGIKLELDEDSNPNAITIENCRFIDIGTRHIKGTRDSNSVSKRITGGAIRNCYFENTVTPPSTGGWHFDGNYTAAIDLMSLDGWVIEDNEFRNIQGYSGEGRSAIMIWYFSENLTIRRNRIINCDRGITLGLSGAELGGGRHVKNALVCNNFILPGSKAGYTSDAGIECSDVDNVKIYHNTIWRLNNDYNGRGIRFIQNIANTEMVNNLVYGSLVFDHNLTISRNENNLSGNLPSGIVVSASAGNLHLTASATGAINKGIQLASVTQDIDGSARGAAPDIGADEYNPPVTPTPSPSVAPTPTPIVGNTQDPPSGGNTQDPPSGGNPQNPPSGGNTQDPPSGGNTQDPPSGGNPQDPPSGGITPTPTTKPSPIPSVTPGPTKTPTPTPKPGGNPEASLITTDYPEMARLLELLFKGTGIHDNNLNATYGAMMKRKAVIALMNASKDKLRELAKLTFPDIRGDEWYASYIPMAVYRKLIKGFPDKTFKGNNLVTRVEVLTMLARFDSSEELIKKKAEQDANSWIRFAELIGNDWYTHYVVAVKDGLPHPNDCTRDTIIKPMTRGEVFFALANFLWKEELQEGGKYHNMAVINEKPAFSDTLKTIHLSRPDGEQKDYGWYMQLAYAAEHPEMGVPMDFYPAILCLKDKGILLGNNGESKWQDPITRAEVLALLERLATVWGAETQ